MKTLLKNPVVFFLVLALLLILGFTIYRQFLRGKAKNGINNKNVRAFLDVIAYAEGTNYANGYRYHYSSRPNNEVLFSIANGWKHPNKVITAGGHSSSAAGRYQVLYSTYLEAATMLGIDGYTPEEQDMIAVYLIYKRGGLDHVLAGRFDEAIFACRKEWASFPGANYPGQGMRSIESLRKEYEKAGGKYHPQ